MVELVILLPDTGVDVETTGFVLFVRSEWLEVERPVIAVVGTLSSKLSGNIQESIQITYGI